ncbi:MULTISPECIES: hypothetical protein [unclassified Embleya]|uniref:hypothetical protein n=1 Tax=unclassified Embleya TaxID=2699296 RepID=UPI0033FD9A31
MVISGMDHPSMPRRVPVPPMDVGRSGVGERLERHLALIGRASTQETASSLESAAIIQSLAPRNESRGHRLARVTLMAPLRAKRRRQIAL